MYIYNVQSIFNVHASVFHFAFVDFFELKSFGIEWLCY